jgi:glycopeptide antibiotics resistance protein
MRGFVWSTPLFLPGVMLTVLIAFVASPGVARWLRCRVSVAFLGLASLGCVLAATLTPDRAVLLDGSISAGGCEFSRLGLIPLADLTRISDPSLNVVLLVPLGFAIGLLPWSRRSMAVLVGAIMLPIAVELIQALLPLLGRGCESADVSDNLTGLVIGLVAGASARLVSGAIRADAPASASSSPDPEG